MDGLFGDGLVAVLCCGGDSLEKDLRWGPRLGALVDLVEFEDGVTNGGVALFKIVEALSGGAFFFSTSVELKTKGAGGGGAGREMMDSNTSLPAILTPKHFLAILPMFYIYIYIYIYICIYTSRAYKEQKKNTNIVYKSNNVHICKIKHTIYKSIKKVA